MLQPVNFLKTFLTFYALTIILMVPCLSLAADIEVNTASDTSTSGDSFCSLREAINSANADASGGDCVAGSGADNITFLADYTITLDGIQLPTVTSEMTISGNGAAKTIIQAHADPGTADYGIFWVHWANGNLTLNGLTVRNGGGFLAGINGGGGLYNEGTLTITDSSITSNTTSSGYGGGIFNSGTLEIIRSTIANNVAGGGGGGIHTIGPTLTLANCTISDNVAQGLGGGIEQGDEGGPPPVVQLINTTVTGNSNDSGGGDGLYLTVAGATFSNSIIADNGEQNCTTLDAAAIPVSLGYNIDSGNTCGLDATGDQVDTAPLLGPLADNGGPTFTHALLPGSPAINSGNATVCTNAPVNGIDQRSVSRPQGGGCDIGAYEYDLKQFSWPMFLPAITKSGVSVTGYWYLYSTSQFSQGEDGPHPIQLIDTSGVISNVNVCGGNVTITGQRTGNNVSMSILFPEGGTGQFSGTVTQSGMSGTFTSTGGDSGTWRAVRQSSLTCP